jgi:hypothetical protein
VLKRSENNSITWPKTCMRGMQNFQRKATQIMAQLNKAQTKNTKFTTIREGLNGMKQMDIKNPDAPQDLPQMTDWEAKLNYIVLDNCQQAREKLEKELKNSLVICAKIHKVAIILTFKGHLPRIEDLGQLKSNEQVFTELEENMKERQMDYRTPSKVMITLMNDHLVKLTRAQNMIQYFMVNLTRDMKTLSQNSTTHEVTPRVLALSQNYFYFRISRSLGLPT